MINTPVGGVTKSKTISRRMFVLSVAKIIVFLVFLEDLFHYKLMRVKNIELFLIKIVLESGDLHRKEGL